MKIKLKSLLPKLHIEMILIFYFLNGFVYVLDHQKNLINLKKIKALSDYFGLD